MDLYTFAHYVYNHGLTLDKIQDATPLERLFYTASMIVVKEEETRNQIALAKLTNPFLKAK